MSEPEPLSYPLPFSPRVISRAQGLKLVVETLMSSLKPIGKHCGHLLCLLHHIWHPGGAGLWGPGQLISRDLSSGLPSWPGCCGSRSCCHLYPRKALKPAFSGLFASWAFCRKLESREAARKGRRPRGLLTSAAKAAGSALMHCSECRRWLLASVCSGVPSPSFLLEPVAGRPGLGDPGPRQLARLAVSWQAGWCRPQTKQCGWGLLKLGFWPRRESWLWRKRKGAACRI